MTDWTIAAFVIVPSCSFSIIRLMRRFSRRFDSVRRSRCVVFWRSNPNRRCFDFEAVGVHALPHIENLGLLVGLKVQSLLEEHLDLC